MDWLRVLAFTLLIFYHTSLVFTNWIISNKESSRLLLNFAYSVSQWRMSLICVVSGVGVFFALKKRSPANFLKERLRRLLVPLLFAVLFITPPQMYYYRLFQGQSLPSYFSFQKTIFQFKLFPEGNFDWFHLWFIGYLLIYCIIALPFFVFLRKEQGRKMLSKGTTLFNSNKWLVFSLVIPLIIAEVLIGLYYNPHGSKFFSLLLFFIYGYVFFSKKQFVETLQEYRKPVLFFAVITGAIVLWVGNKSYVGDVYINSGRTPFVLGKVLKTVNIFLWVSAIAGYARKWLSFNHPVLKYANSAVYPVYILHQTVIVILAYYLVKLPVNVAGKFGMISVGTLGTCLLIYEFIIRRNKVTRFLFGLKPKPLKNKIKDNSDILQYKPLKYNVKNGSLL